MSHSPPIVIPAQAGIQKNRLRITRLDSGLRRNDGLCNGANANPSVEFHIGDMLDFLRQRRDNEAALIFSGWAIGYSQPAAIIAEASRVLRPEGQLAIIVNRFDTMPAVFNAFRQTMRRYPNALGKALLPRFPKSADVLAQSLKHNGFRIDFLEEGAVPIELLAENRLDWLLGTGILAGFDAVLPLRVPGEIRNYFAEVLDQTATGWEHRFVILVAVKRAKHKTLSTDYTDFPKIQ